MDYYSGVEGLPQMISYLGVNRYAAKAGMDGELG